MAETLLYWINTETKLSKPIKNIEKDFSSGYYIAEILNRYNELPSLDNFTKETNEPYYIYKNFKLLKQTLEKMNIYLDEDNIKQIMSETKGSAAKLIYKIKTQVSRKSINFDSLMSKTSLNKKYDMTQSTFKTTYNTAPTETDNKKNMSNTTAFRGKIKLEPIRQNMFYQRHANKPNYRNISNLNEIIEEKTNEKSTVQPTTNNRNSYLSTEEKRSMLNNPTFIASKQPLSFSDSAAFCNYNSLDNNMLKMGMDIKTIDPKLKKYGVGENGIYIPTDLVVKKVTNIVNAEKIRIAEEKESHKLPTEQEKLLKQSIISKVSPLLSNEEEKGFISTVKLSSKSKQFKQMKYENYRKTNFKIEPRKRNISFYTSNVFQPNTTKHFSITKETAYDAVFNPYTFFTSLDKETLPERLRTIEHKKKIREKNLPKISDIFDLIFDLTEECYNYQTEQNDSLVDLPGWRDWMQMFVDGKSCRKAPKISKAYLDRGVSPIKTKKETEEEENKKILKSEYCYGEYFDYLTYRANWSSTIIPNKIFGSQVKVYDILGNDIATLLSSGKLILQGVKQSTLKQMTNEAFEMKNEEKENVVIPKTTVRNQLLGEIIELNCDNCYKDINANNGNAQLSTFTYNHIPIKLCLIGHLFSGRKTQGKIIAEMYPNIKIYSIDELIQKYVEIYEKINTPIESHPKYKSLKKAQIEQIQKEKDELEESIKDIKEIIEPYAKKEIETLSDENMIKILMYNIQNDFPFKDEKTLTEEINTRNQRKSEIEQELEKIHEEQAKKPKAKVKEEQTLKNELEKINTESYSGFIIVDFPRTYNQYILFEKMTTGFTQQIDKPVNQRDLLVYELTYGIDKHYHNNEPSNEGIHSQGSTSLFDKYIWIEVDEEETLRRVKNRKKDPNTGIVYHMEDNPPPENDKKLNERLVEVTEPTIEETQKELQVFDEKFPEILDFLALFKKTKKIDTKEKTEITNEIVNVMNTTLKTFEDLENKDFIADINNNAHLSMDVDETEGEKYIKRLTESKKKVQYSTSEQIINEWSSFNKKYLLTIKQIINFFQHQKTKVIHQMGLIQTGFIEFLNSPTKKKELINIFINKYNTFMKEFIFLKKNATVKEEFMRDLSELTGHYWELINMKKTQAINERMLIIKSGFIERQVELFYNNLEKMFLIETEKFEISMNIIQNFYYSFEPNKVQETNPFLFEVNPNIILKDTKDLQIIDDLKKTSPKIEKIFSNCFKIFFEYDLRISTIEANIKAQAAIAALNMSGISSISHRKKKTITNPREVKFEQSIFSEAKEIISYEDELKAAISNEKNKFKLRAIFLKYFGIKYIKELFSIANKTFDNLDEWIIHSVKMQNDVMNEIISHFREQIENNESKLEYNEEMDKFDIYTLLNLKFEEFDVQRGIDIKEENKLIDIAELNKCYQDLKSYEIQNNFITETSLIDILLRKNLIDKKSKGFSNTFRSLPFYNLNLFIQKLIIHTENDRKLIRLNHLFILLLVLHFPLMNEDKEKEANKSVEGKFKFHCYLEREDFMNCHLWFEDTTDKEYSKSIKEMLFNINKNDNNEINFVELINVLRLKTITITNRDNELLYGDEETYYDILIN